MRLIGTFLDPPFIGLIVVFGLIISIVKFIRTKNKWMLILTSFFLVTLAFTYSRGSYLALIAGVAVMGIYAKKIKVILAIVLGLVLLVIILPTSRNLNLNIFRISSITDRLNDYTKTVSIIKSSPLFGVGYDNICLAKAKIDGGVNFFYHDCSGSNSSLLYVMATTGIVGFISYIYLLIKTLKFTNYDMLYASIFAAFLVSGFFNNTMFYSWLMGYMAILLAVSLRSEV